MADSAAPLLDSSHLTKLRALQDGEEPGLVAELVQDFLTRASFGLQQLRENLAVGDAQAMELQAHSLAGLSGMFGLMRMHVQCKALESLAEERRLEGAGELLAQVEQAYEQARPLLLAELSLPE